MRNYLSRFLKKSTGFTLIELLIVIAILGILAVAVLSAINPVEQINRGRDTGTQSDAEQLLSAISRFNASNGYFPWLSGADDTTAPGTNKTGTGPSGGGTMVAAKDNASAVTTPPTGAQAGFYVDGVYGAYTHNGTSYAAANSNVLQVLGSDTTVTRASQELQLSYVNRLNGSGYNTLYVFNNGGQGDSTYVCFKPASAQFKAAAATRCGTGGAGMPSDLKANSTVLGIICDDTAKIYYTCLP